MVTIEEAVLSHINKAGMDRTVKLYPLQGVYRSSTGDLYAPYKGVLYALGFSREDIEMNFFEHMIIHGRPYVLPLAVASYIRQLEANGEGKQ
jgi:hypothetical protein